MATIVVPTKILLQIITNKQISIEIQLAIIVTIEPVSYTHLDVYKRQVYARACMCMRMREGDSYAFLSLYILNYVGF